MSNEHQIYKLVPVPGGFEAVWGFSPVASEKPIYKWSEDSLERPTAPDKDSA